jgi:hypothetical protein
VQQEGLVEPALVHVPGLAGDVPGLQVDLRGLREAGELLVRGLGGDDAGGVRPEAVEAHGVMAGEQRVELHEAGPGLVEQDVVAEVADALQDHLGVVDGAVVAALLDDGEPERALGPPPVRVGDQRVRADGRADALLVERVVVDGPDQALRVAVGRQVHGDAPGQHQGAVVVGLVVVAVEQHEVAPRDQRAADHLVGGGGAVEHEVGAVGAEDLRRGRFGLPGGALVHQQVAELDHRVVEVGAEDGLAQVLVEHVPDRALAVEHAAVVAGARPYLVAGLGELDDAPEERGLELLDVLLEVPVDVLGHEVRRVLLRIDQAAHHAGQQPMVMLLEIVGRYHEEHRDVQADVIERLHDPLPVDAVAALPAPLEQQAADRGVVAQADDGVMGGADEVGAQVMAVAKASEDALERVVQRSGALDARVDHQDREHVLVRHDLPPQPLPSVGRCAGGRQS